MSAYRPRRGSHPPTAAAHAAARLRRPAGVLAALTCGLLASAATVPAAFAKLPPGVEVVKGARPAQVPPAPIRVITAGGMPGWQITLIALAAALVVALVTATVIRARRWPAARPVQPGRRSS
jgi:hypothetical protein